MKTPVFEDAELGRKLSADKYNRLEPRLRTDLLQIQHQLKSAKFSVLLIISGVDGAGKGETVNLLHEWLDPRFLNATAFGEPTDEERARPEYWRFWRRLPPKGRIGIFFGSWYTEPIINRVYRRIGKKAFAGELQRVNSTEKMLADDGTLILKLWFHLSKRAQKKRLKRLQRDPDTRWRVTKTDWDRFGRYDRFRKISAEAIRATHTPSSPWKVVEGEDAHWRSIVVGRYLLSRIKARLAPSAASAPRTAAPMPAPKKLPATALDKLDLSLKLEEDYKVELLHAQGRLNRLFRKAKDKGVASVLLFEGWDAAGKGGAVRRITAALDARDYLIVPIAAPTDEEKARHYLWRFWRWVPTAGRLTIFDRSWYGRVLVERVEGFATPDEWQRAYAEINCFEEHLRCSGIVLVKYFLHIDPDEQLRRFKEREKVAYKKFKITEEDYRNRAKMPQYTMAVGDMIERTSTEAAPWTLVEANDKAYARIKVLKTYGDRLEEALDSARPNR